MSIQKPILFFFFTLSWSLLFAQGSIEMAKTNGVKFLLEENSDSPYNLIIKDIVEEYWTFSDYSFLEQSEYRTFSGEEKQYVLGIYDITIEFETSTNDIKVFACLNGHKHIAKKSKKIASQSVVSQDYISEVDFRSNNLKAIITSFVKEHNNRFEKLLNKEKLGVPTLSYGYLKSKKSSIGTLPIYILKKDMVFSDSELLKLKNSNVKIVTQDEINNAIFTNADVLIYRNNKYISNQSIKKLVNAKTGEVYIYVLNRNLEHYNKSVLKNVLKQLAP